MLHILSVCVALRIQHAMHMLHIAVSGLLGSSIFFFTSHKRHDFQNKEKLLNIKFVFLFCVLCLDLHVNCTISLCDFNETGNFSKNIKFHEIPSIENRVIPC